MNKNCSFHSACRYNGKQKCPKKCKQFVGIVTSEEKQKYEKDKKVENKT